MTRPLLIFDSGVGGLSVLAAVRRELPNAPFVYAADSAGFPYGTKSSKEIEARVPALLGRLTERVDPEIIVIACNTASTIALDSVRAALDLPIVGTVPAIKPAALVSKTRVIGVLGTQATVVQPYVDRLAAEFAADCTIIRHGSAELVTLAEAKLRGEPVPIDAVRAAIAPMLDAPGGDRLDTIVLACTHFPLLVDELAVAVARNVTFVDGADGIARRTAYLTRHVDWGDQPAQGHALFTGRDFDAAPYRSGLARFGIVSIGLI